MRWARIAGLVLVGLSTACAEQDRRPPEERHVQGKVLAAEPFRLMTYNIRHAEGSSLAAIAAVIHTQAPDLVGLQEVDENTARSGRVDQADELARLTGLHVSFQPALRSFDGGRYGVALLSRTPIVSSQRFALPSQRGDEERILALMIVEHDTLGRIPVGVTHLDHRSEPEREEQARAIVALLAGQPRAILLGDLNATPFSGAYATLARGLNDRFIRDDKDTPYTFPADSPRVQIDHILIGADWLPGRASTLDARWQSDHRPLMAGIRPKAALQGDSLLPDTAERFSTEQDTGSATAAPRP